MFLDKLIVLVLLSVGLSVNALASDKISSPEQLIRASFLKSRPDIEITSIKPAVAKGLYEVELAVGDVLYSTADGKHFVLGQLFGLSVNGLVNITEQSNNAERKEALAGLGTDKMIIFSPKNGKVKAYVTVFTDVDCGYCRKLHKEVPKLNEMGIEVRYLGYPRAGIGSASHKKLTVAWCADNPQKMLTSLKNRKSVDMKECEDSPVAEHFLLGQRLGVTGTPALITAEGRLLPGYMPAARLAEELGVN